MPALRERAAVPALDRDARALLGLPSALPAQLRRYVDVHAGAGPHPDPVRHRGGLFWIPGHELDGGGGVRAGDGGAADRYHAQSAGAGAGARLSVARVPPRSVGRDSRWTGVVGVGSGGVAVTLRPAIAGTA